MNSLSLLIQSSTKSFNTKYDLQRVQRLLSENSKIIDSTLAEELKKTIENINTNIRWVDRNYKSVKLWLSNYIKANNLNS
jgi:hypothetical protein